MSREKQGFHDTMTLLNEMFPGKGMLNQTEVAQFMGVHRTTAARRIRFNSMKMVTKPDFARQICL